MNIFSVATTANLGVASTNLLAAASVSIDWNTIIMAAIGMVGAAITSIIGYMVLRLREESALAREEAKEAKATAKVTADEISKVHVAVNSERTATQTELQELRAEVLRLSTVGAVLAVKAGVQPEVTPPVTTTPSP